MYHFRLKTDKKPDGTRVSPVQHIDYIRHEGKYLEEKEWGEKNKFAGDLITSAEVKNACKDLGRVHIKESTIIENKISNLS